MKTNSKTRQMLTKHRENAKAVPVEAEGLTLIERKSRKIAATVASEGRPKAQAYAKYLARAATMSPYLIKDMDELLERMAYAKTLLENEAARGVKIPAEAIEMLHVEDVIAADAGDDGLSASAA